MQVVLKRRLANDGQRKGQVTLQNLPFLSAHIFEIDGREVTWETFVGGVELNGHGCLDVIKVDACGSMFGGQVF